MRLCGISPESQSRKNEASCMHRENRKRKRNAGACAEHRTGIMAARRRSPYQCSKPRRYTSLASTRAPISVSWSISNWSIFRFFKTNTSCALESSSVRLRAELDFIRNDALRKVTLRRCGEALRGRSCEGTVRSQMAPSSSRAER